MNVNDSTARRPILLVEDNDLDYQAIERGLRKLQVRNPVTRLRTGDEALAWVRMYSIRQTSGDPPVLVILDLNLPDTHGREILTALKSHEELRVIPVIVWSVSSDPLDIKLCYLDGANSYVQKSVSIAGTEELLRSISAYWLELVSLPPPQTFTHA